MIKAQYREHSAASNLEVFCVSNQLYWADRMKSAAVSKRRLDLSGIIELRRYCIGIVAEIHLRTVNHYICNEIPAFLGSATLWASEIVALYKYYSR